MHLPTYLGTLMVPVFVQGQIYLGIGIPPSCGPYKERIPGQDAKARILSKRICLLSLIIFSFRIRSGSSLTRLYLYLDICLGCTALLYFRYLSLHGHCVTFCEYTFDVAALHLVLYITTIKAPTRQYCVLRISD